MIASAALTAMNTSLDKPLNAFSLFVSTWNSAEGVEQLVVLVDYCYSFYIANDIDFQELLQLLTLPCGGSVSHKLLFKEFRSIDVRKMFRIIIKLLREIHFCWNLYRVTVYDNKHALTITYYRKYGENIVLKVNRIRARVSFVRARNS